MNETNYLSIDKIFERCVQRNFNTGEIQKGAATNLQLYNQLWLAFIKWTKSQIDLDRTVSLPNFATISQRFFVEEKE